METCKVYNLLAANVEAYNKNGDQMHLERMSIAMAMLPTFVKGVNYDGGDMLLFVEYPVYVEGDRGTEIAGYVTGHVNVSPSLSNGYYMEWNGDNDEWVETKESECYEEYVKEHSNWDGSIETTPPTYYPTYLPREVYVERVIDEIQESLNRTVQRYPWVPCLGVGSLYYGPITIYPPFLNLINTGA